MILCIIQIIKLQLLLQKRLSEKQGKLWNTTKKNNLYLLITPRSIIIFKFLTNFEIK